MWLDAVSNQNHCKILAIYLTIMDGKVENLEANNRAMLLEGLQVGAEVIVAELPDVGVVGAALW